jgi:phasin family protein
MTYTADQFAAMTQARLKSLKELTEHGLEGLKKLVKLNNTLTKTSLAGGFSHCQALLDIKSPQQFLSLQVAQIKPLAEQFSAYGWEAFSIAFDASTEFNKAADVAQAQMQKFIFETVESLAQHSPMNSESAMGALKSAMNAGQEAILSAQSSARQAVALAESSLTSMRHQGADSSTVKVH